MSDQTRMDPEMLSMITVDALNGRRYKGEVIEIGASAHAGQSGAQASIRQFTVKVAVTNPDNLLKPGITARVKLIADKRKDVLTVPIGAIRTEEKEGQQLYYVFVAAKGKVKKKVITVGMSDDANTEVKTGLKEGDEVITGPYSLLRTMREGDVVKIKPQDKDKKHAKKDEGGPAVEVN